MEMKNHEILEQKMCKELEKIANRISANPNADMSTQDLCLVKDLYSALMKQATYISMKEAEEYENGMSGRRGRSPMTGRYVSRDSGESYSEGFDRGYSEAMNQSGHHYPMGYYPPRW